MFALLDVDNSGFITKGSSALNVFAVFLGEGVAFD